MVQDPRPADPAHQGPSVLVVTILLTSTVLLAGVAVLWQEQHLGLPYIESQQLARHRDVLAGSAPMPYRYRVLGEWVAAALVKGSQVLHVPRPVATGFLALRLLQNLLALVLTFAYYRRLGMHSRQALIGVMVLAFAFTHAIDNSDLSFNTYFDVIFYLLAALTVLSGRTLPFLAVVVAAALNRDTSGLIPLLPLAEWAGHPRALPPDWRRRACLSALALAIWFAIFLGLRIYRGAPPEPWEAYWGTWGLARVFINLSSRHVLMFLALTLSILPILTLWDFARLPAFVKGMFWLMVPVWFGVHLSIVNANETRLFLVPIAIVLIPGALYCRRQPAEPVEAPG
jgi:hypothetical protein